MSFVMFCVAVVFLSSIVMYVGSIVAGIVNMIICGIAMLFIGDNDEPS